MPPTPNFATLDGLVDLISSSVATMKADWEQAGFDQPCLDSIAVHPIDGGAAQSLAYKNALRTLEGACAQLVATTASPAHVLTDLGMKAYTVACLRVVYETDVAKYLAEAGPEGLGISELGTKTGVEGQKLARLLRLLASRHVFREVRPNVFANNRFSVRLQRGDPLCALLGHLTDDVSQAAMHLHEVLLDPVWGPSYAPEQVALARAFNLNGKTLFRWTTEEPEGIPRNARFGQAMMGIAEVIGAEIVNKAYPWKDLPRGAVIDDVGSGVGHISMSIAKHYPTLKFVLQDLPLTLEDGRKVWDMAFPEALADQRVQFVPIDFLNESPVANCDIYYMKHILHDWNDEDCKLIMTNIRKVMKPRSKIVVQEYIIKYASRVPDAQAAYDQAPLPLLPNYGVGGQRQYNLDFNMMVMLNAKERTLDDFIRLGENAGLRFLGVYDAGETGLVEYGIAEPS